MRPTRLINHGIISWSSCSFHLPLHERQHLNGLAYSSSFPALLSRSLPSSVIMIHSLIHSLLLNFSPIIYHYHPPQLFTHLFISLITHSHWLDSRPPYCTLCWPQTHSHLIILRTRRWPYQDQGMEGSFSRWTRKTRIWPRILWILVPSSSRDILARKRRLPQGLIITSPTHCYAKVD